MIIVITIIAFIFLFFLIVILRVNFYKRRWRKTLQHQYIEKARKEIKHGTHKQRVILWLMGEGEENYLDSPYHFEEIYQRSVDYIGDDIIEELTKKYKDEYKSRNTKNTKTI